MRITSFVAGVALAGAVAYGCRDAAGPGAAVAAVTVTPESSRLEPGATTRLEATPLDAAGQPLTGRDIFWASEDDAIAEVSATGVVTARHAGTVRIAASSEGKSGVAEVTVRARVNRVSLVPEHLELTVGGSLSMQATARDVEGLPLGARETSWMSSDPGVATVSSTGVVTAIAPGAAVISAESEGVTGVAPVVVQPVRVAALSVSPERVAIGVGESVLLVARPLDAAGGTLAGRSIGWSSSSPAVAVVSSLGLLLGRAPGDAVITASSEGRSATVAVTVRGVPPASLTIVPGDGAVYVGGALPLTVVARDAAGTVLLGRDAEWVTSDASVAIVSAGGLVTGVAPGRASISARLDDLVATVTVVVSVVPPMPPAAVHALTITSVAERLVVGASLQLGATPRDADGAPLPGRAIIWVSDDPDVASVTQGGLVTAESPGSATITATSESQSASATITVVRPPDPPPPPRPVVRTVAVSPASSALMIGEATQLAATVRDESGAVLTDRVVEWQSSDPDVASVTQSGLVSAIARGVATITARVEGQLGAAAIVVAPRPPPPPEPVRSVAVEPSAASVPIGDRLQLTAIARDAEGRPLSDRPVEWRSADPTIATVSSAGLVTAIGAGTVAVTAVIEGVPGASSITVPRAPDPLPTPVHRVVVTPASGSVQVGSTLQLSAATLAADGTALGGRAVAWRSSDAAIASVSSSGLVTGKAAGGVTITATSEGVSGTAALTIVAPPPPPPPPAPPVRSVTVTPPAAILFVGRTLALTATLRDADGAVLTDRVIEWRTSRAEGAPGSATGVVTATGLGVATITASSEGRSGTATVSVRPAPVASLVIAPSSAEIKRRASVKLEATVYDADGRELTDREVTWTTSDARIATVDRTGLVVGVRRGSATITATSEGIAATATVKVIP